jgi:hypothetical protein
MQMLVIGDIHGCFHELQALLDKAGLVDEDAIISLGDCVDRGPETPQVLNFLKENPNAQVLMGNHERKHVRGSRGEVALARSQQISKIQFGETYPDALEFMRRLPLFIDLPEALLVHGYFEPGLSSGQQNPMVLCGTMGGDRYLRERYERPWYELYNGEKPILVGHHNYTGTDQPFVYRERVFGLDTSCVTGKTLTGLLLPSFRFVSVPSRTNHWSHVRRQYPIPVKTPHPKRRTPAAWDEADDDTLDHLIALVNQTCASILCTLHTEPGYADLSSRKQAQRFGERAGTGDTATLLQLARLGKLHAEIARKILGDSQALKDTFHSLEFLQ